MSKIENQFIKWFAWIAGSLILVSILGMVNMYRGEAIIEQKIEQQQEINTQINKRIDETRIMHYQDLKIIRQSITNIEISQTITQSDIKKILVKLPKK